MISFLKGTLIFKNSDGITLDVGGVGYEIFVSQVSFYKLPPVGQTTELFIHTHVAEGVLALYGFTDFMEKTLFRKLIAISGIGPKVSLSILSGMPVSEFLSAISDENILKLTSINGVGRKTAERLVVELKEKVLKWNLEMKMEDGTGAITQSARVGGSSLTYEDVLSALLNLGYNRPTAERALTNIVIRPDSTVESVLKESLTVLSR